MSSLQGLKVGDMLIVASPRLMQSGTDYSIHNVVQVNEKSVVSSSAEGIARVVTWRKNTGRAWNGYSGTAEPWTLERDEELAKLMEKEKAGRERRAMSEKREAEWRDLRYRLDCTVALMSDDRFEALKRAAEGGK